MWERLGGGEKDQSKITGSWFSFLDKSSLVLTEREEGRGGMDLRDTLYIEVTPTGTSHTESDIKHRRGGGEYDPDTGSARV